MTRPGQTIFNSALYGFMALALLAGAGSWQPPGIVQAQ